METLPSLTYEEADEKLIFEDSYSRLHAIFFMYRQMQHNEWLKLLGEYWSVCDNIATIRTALKSRIGTVGPIAEMMDNEEQAAYDALPDIVTIYRGCGKKNIAGASWSLDRDIAARFPFLVRYKAREPLLVTAKVKKSNILAVKLDRNELEIITFSAKRVSIEALYANEVLSLIRE